MIFALVVLGTLLMSALVCWSHPSRPAAFALTVFAAMWLTANNGHLEGRVLIVVDPKHGLTAADLISYGGFALALVTVLRWSRGQAAKDAAPLAPPGPDAFPHSAGMRAIAGLAVVVISALVFDWVHQPN